MNGDKIQRRLTLDNTEEIKRCLLGNHKITKNGCWEWQKFVDVNGYGIKNIHGKNYKVHRLSKMVFDGFDIHSTLKICHKCDNKRCINPAHLFSGTQKDNVHDMFKKSRANSPQGERNFNTKLSIDKVTKIRGLYKSGMKTVEISQIFNVTSRNIRHICARKTWKHVT